VRRLPRFQQDLRRRRSVFPESKSLVQGAGAVFAEHPQAQRHSEIPGSHHGSLHDSGPDTTPLVRWVNYQFLKMNLVCQLLDDDIAARHTIQKQNACGLGSPGSFEESVLLADIPRPELTLGHIPVRCVMKVANEIPVGGLRRKLLEVIHRQRGHPDPPSY
jgi:hypothetical protein